MTLDQAQRYSEKLVNWLTPFCERIEIAGSVRRQRPACNDVDLVAISKIKEERDLFGNVTKWTPLLHQFLDDYVRSSNGRARWKSGTFAQYNLFLELPKCQLDIWCAERANFGSVLLCRTGSKEHNVWLCQRAQALGTKWEPMKGMNGYGSTEDEVYHEMGLPFIHPRERELELLQRRFPSPVKMAEFPPF